MAGHINYVGRYIGDYRLLRRLGGGGFGDVYLGEHVRTQVQAAVKVLQMRLTRSDDLKEFINEARTFRLRHPHIIPLLDFGIDSDDMPYLVMEYASNGTLRDTHPKGTRVPLSTILSYVAPLSSALQYAHDQHLIHRDVKPENMLLDAHNTVLLSDFGIAAAAHSSRSLNAQEGIGGTLPYMAPEQIQGKPRPASDQYALGIVVYEWLTGARPFRGTTVEIAMQHSMTPPPPLRDQVPTLSIEVEQVVLTALAKKPEHRFASVMAFARALEQVAMSAQAEIEEKNPVLPVLIPSVRAPILQERAEIAEEDHVFASLLASQSTAEKSVIQAELQSSEPFLLKFAKFGKHIVGSLWKLKQCIPTPPASFAGTLSAIPFPESEVSKDSLKDFFISYTRIDFSWAKWIKWQLDKAGHSTVLRPWGVHSDSNFEKEIQTAGSKARRMILVVSPSYLNIFANQNDWNATFRQKVIDEKGFLLAIGVHKCGQEFTKLLESINYLDISEDEETAAVSMLLAAVGNGSIELTIQPIFPGESGDKAPTFPVKGLTSLDLFRPMDNTGILSYPSITSTSFLQQIHNAFAEEDWQNVIRKVNYLLKFAPDTLSSEIYHMQGRALLGDGDKQHASEALYNALALSVDSSQRLTLLEEYTAILVSSKQWSEALHSTQEALRLAPENPIWYARQQQYLMQLKAIEAESVPIKSSLVGSTYMPLISPVKSLEIFFSYSHKDEEMRFELDKYLSNLKRQRSISGWYDGEISAGVEWAQEIDKHLSQANIILLLISQDFIASHYCYEIEMMRALERHRKGESCVIPIILRPSHWEVTHFGKLQALPIGGKPITLWSNHDEAFLNVARGIQKVVDRLAINRSL